MKNFFDTTFDDRSAATKALSMYQPLQRYHPGLLHHHYHHDDHHPGSPELIDNLIAINLTVSISLLMVALYIPKAVQPLDVPLAPSDHHPLSSGD